jgi:hypothetical protein
MMRQSSSKNEFSKHSFMIDGINKFQNKIRDITYSSLLYMKLDTTNESITIHYNDMIIGFVPKDRIQNIKEYVNDPLKVVIIDSRSDTTYIRVIPEKLFGKI